MINPTAFGAEDSCCVIEFNETLGNKTPLLVDTISNTEDASGVCVLIPTCAFNVKVMSKVVIVRSCFFILSVLNCYQIYVLLQ